MGDRHDVDVKALLRVAVVHNVPIACNRATADFLLSSPLMHTYYDRLIATTTVSDTVVLSARWSIRCA